MRSVFSAQSLKGGLPEPQAIRELAIRVPAILEYCESVVGGILTGPINSESPTHRSGGTLYVIHDGSPSWHALEDKLRQEIERSRVRLVLRSHSLQDVANLHEARVSLTAELKWAEKNGERVIKQNPANFFPTFEVTLQEDIADYLLHKQEEYEAIEGRWSDWEHERQCELLEDLFQSSLVTVLRRVLLAAHGEAAFDTKDLLQGFAKHLPTNPTVQPLVDKALKLLAEIAERDYYYGHELSIYKISGYEARVSGYIGEVLRRTILLLKCCRQLVKAIMSGHLEEPKLEVLSDPLTEDGLRSHLGKMAQKALRDIRAGAKLEEFIKDPSKISRSA